MNVFPALDQVTISGSNANVTPVLLGNAIATDIATGLPVTLNVTDPDSITINPAGDLVLVDQAGSELVILHAPGTTRQTVSRLSLPTQVEDTVWATSTKGPLLMVAATANTTYSIRTPFIVGRVFTETPNASSVPGLVRTVDVKAGFLTPVIIGFGKPTGLLFVPDRT